MGFRVNGFQGEWVSGVITFWGEDVLGRIRFGVNTFWVEYVLGWIRFGVNTFWGEVVFG